MRDPAKAIERLHLYVEVASDVHAQVEERQEQHSTFFEMLSDTDAFQGLPDAVRAQVLELEPSVELILETADADLARQFQLTPNLRERADIVRRATAALRSRAEVEGWLGPAEPVLDPRGLSPVVAGPATVYWDAGQYRVAVDEAARAINVHLQTKLGRRDLDGTDLARQAFSPHPPSSDEPRLRFPGVDRSSDERTWKSRHQGAMEFGAGLFQAVRNITAHADPAEEEPAAPYALDCLAAFSLLGRWIDEAERHVDGV